MHIIKVTKNSCGMIKKRVFSYPKVKSRKRSAKTRVPVNAVTRNVHTPNQIANRHKFDYSSVLPNSQRFSEPTVPAAKGDNTNMWDKAVFVATCLFTFLFWKITKHGHNAYKFNLKFVIFYFYSSVCAFCVWPFFLFNPKSVHNARFGAWLIKPVTKLYNLEWNLRNGEILAEERGAVIVSNHQSSLDILGLFNIWHVIYKMTVIAKKELFYIWPFGLSAYFAGVVFVDRTKARNAYKQLEITSEVMVKNKTKIWVFAEGTRNKDYTKLLPFKKGAFTMAVAAQVPIIPVVFSPYYFINKKRHIFDKGHVIIQCLEPVNTKGLSPEDVPDLINRVHHKMSLAYKELGKEVVDSLPSDYPFTTIG